jgi:hypothetical protein
MAYPDLLGHILKACSPVTQLGLSMVVEDVSEIICILCVTSYSFEIIAKIAIVWIALGTVLNSFIKGQKSSKVILNLQGSHSGPQ